MMSVVSIQLISPASGKDEQFYRISIQYHDVSIQLMSPASGDALYLFIFLYQVLVSIQLMSPASGDYYLFIIYQRS